MKIGIMTMQRIKNYGSYLQAFGLKKIIESLGHEVEFVDFRFEKQIIFNKKSLIKKILNNKNIFKYIKKKMVVKKYTNAFENIFIPELCGKEMNYRPNNIDMLIIGSDEVFNCLQEYPVGYSRELFGFNYENIPVISYAASFGQTDYDRLKEYNIDSEVGELLKKFKNISVRDNKSYETVYKITNKYPTLNLDPVLVYDYSKDIIDNVKIDNYIIVYAYPGRLTKVEKKKIKQFAKKYNKKIVSFGMYQDISDEEIIINPLEIFSYFKYADFIITDTFHGSIFSIKTHSKFCTIVRNNKGGNSNKLVDLLERLKLEDRILSSIDNLESMYYRKIDYKLTENIIDEEKSKTKKYLEENLSGLEN